MAKSRWLVVGVFLVLPLASMIKLSAFSTGISGFSGNPATGGANCNECHQGGVTPAVALDGPTLVQPGSTHTYTLTVSGGQRIAGGLDVSATDGALSVLDPETFLLDGEITHRTPRIVNLLTQEAIWAFNWTAPPTPGSAILYGAGDSVDLAGGPNGDAAGTDALAITVAGASTPGETSGPDRAPLLVTAFDPSTGDMTLGYATGCGTSSNNVYYGLLDQVGTLTWSGEVCDIGVSGTLAGFNPGTDSYFFLVVGHEGTDEGSYGKRRRTDGSEVERQPHAGNTCGQTQDLSATCGG
jgi:hypothetical protein